jgi:hypothetical protein
LHDCCSLGQDLSTGLKAPLQVELYFTALVVYPLDGPYRTFTFGSRINNYFLIRDTK